MENTELFTNDRIVYIIALLHIVTDGSMIISV